MQNGYAGDNENDSQVDMLNIVTYPFVKKHKRNYNSVIIISEII